MGSRSPKPVSVTTMIVFDRTVIGEQDFIKIAAV